MSATRNNNSREEGSGFFLCLLILLVLFGLCLGLVAVGHANTRQARDFRLRTDLHAYAESAVALAFHELKLEGKLTKKGVIGTGTWSNDQHDTGRDGKQGTYDEGEGDGLPTPGEPQVYLQPIGPPSLGAGVVAYIADTGYADIHRIVATAATSDTIVTVEEYVFEERLTVPLVGALYLGDSPVVNLSGNFLFDGTDHYMDGSPRTGVPAAAGLATAIADPPGDNQAFLLSQIDPQFQDQIIGDGGWPSIQEEGSVDFMTTFNGFKEAQTQTLAPGSYSGYSTGDPSANDWPITYVDGNVQLGGQTTGAGVLVVEGELTVTGKMNWTGLIIVLGDMRIQGETTITGAVMVQQVIAAVENPGNAKFTGSATVQYSSEVLQAIQDTLETSYESVYYTTQ